jgi:hypothetical protein
MEEQGSVLRHLLEIESKAAVLVDDAQAEADKRIKEAEERNRAGYEENYRLLVEKLDGEYRERIAGVKAGYNADLETYRSSLDATLLHQTEFSALAERLLFGVEDKCRQ